MFIVAPESFLVGVGVVEEEAAEVPAIWREAVGEASLVDFFEDFRDDDFSPEEGGGDVPGFHISGRLESNLNLDSSPIVSVSKSIYSRRIEAGVKRSGTKEQIIRSPPSSTKPFWLETRAPKFNVCLAGFQSGHEWRRNQSFDLFDSSCMY